MSVHARILHRAEAVRARVIREAALDAYDAMRLLGEEFSRDQWVAVFRRQRWTKSSYSHAKAWDRLLARLRLARIPFKVSRTGVLTFGQRAGQRVEEILGPAEEAA